MQRQRQQSMTLKTGPYSDPKPETVRRPVQGPTQREAVERFREEARGRGMQDHEDNFDITEDEGEFMSPYEESFLDEDFDDRFVNSLIDPFLGTLLEQRRAQRAAQEAAALQKPKPAPAPAPQQGANQPGAVQ